MSLFAHANMDVAKIRSSISDLSNPTLINDCTSWIFRSTGCWESFVANINILRCRSFKACRVSSLKTESITSSVFVSWLYLDACTAAQYMQRLYTEQATAPNSVSWRDKPPWLYIMPLNKGVLAFSVSGSCARTNTYSPTPVSDGVTFIASSCSGVAFLRSTGYIRCLQKGTTSVNSVIGSTIIFLPLI